MVIRGYARQIRLTSEMGEEAQKEMMAKAFQIEITTGRISQITRGLLAFARHEPNSDFQDVGLKDLVSETISFCQSNFDFSGVKLELKNIP